jgi:antitoxin component of MazEF toxin-antitoxin module
MALTTKVRKVGNSQGIIVPAAVIRQLNWEDATEVELRTQGDELIIAPRRYAKPEEFERSARKVFGKREKLMRRLAK